MNVNVFYSLSCKLLVNNLKSICTHRTRFYRRFLIICVKVHFLKSTVSQFWAGLAPGCTKYTTWWGTVAVVKGEEQWGEHTALGNAGADCPSAGCDFSHSASCLGSSNPGVMVLNRICAYVPGEWHIRTSTQHPPTRLQKLPFMGTEMMAEHLKQGGDFTQLQWSIEDHREDGSS